MESLVQMITQPWMVTVFVSIILLIALRPLYQAVFTLGAANRDVTEAIGVLARLGKNRQDEFYSQFKAVHSQILRIPGLRHTWREFVDSMYFEDAATTTLHKKAYISHRPAHYFNRDSVLGARLNLPQFFAYPNYLIGIGLTFTFIGLAAALHVAQAGLASGAGQQALKDLLAVAALKFISSIVGISSSLAVSAVQRVRVRAFQQKLNAFCDLLEECTKYKSAEKLLHDSFHEQRRQTAAMNGLGAAVADRISDALGGRLSESVASGLDPLARELRLLAQNFSEGSEDALRSIAEAFLVALRDNSLSEMRDLMERAGRLRDSLHRLTEHMESTGKSFDSVTQASAHRLHEMLDNFAVAFPPAQFGESLQALREAASLINQAGGDAHAAADGNRNAALELERMVRGLAAPLAIMEQALSGLSQSLGSVERAAARLDDAGAAIAAAAGEFKDSAASVKRSGDHLQQNMKTLESFAGAISEAAAALEKTAGKIGGAPGKSGMPFLKFRPRWRKQ